MTNQTEISGAASSKSLTALASRRLMSDRRTLAAVLILIAVILMSILAPSINAQVLHVDVYQTNLVDRFLPIGSPGHLLGTDQLGRDLLARLLVAGEVTLGISFMASLIGLVMGFLLGILASYSTISGNIIHWVVGVVESVPVLVIIVTVVVRSYGFSDIRIPLALLLGLLQAIGITRLIAGEIRSLQEIEFVQFAYSAGASYRHIVLTHILPNSVATGLILLPTTMANAMLAESVLSFLGIGISPPTPTWGNMLTNAQMLLLNRGSNIIILPGLMISISIICLNIIAEGLRSAFYTRIQ